MKLSVKAFGLAGGLLWGVCLFLWTLLLALTSIEWGKSVLTLMVGFYPYFDITVAGAFVGLLAGFLDGFIGCAIFAWLYNRFAILGK